MKVDETVAVVTGGASGLGAAVVGALHARNVRVVVFDLAEPAGGVPEGVHTVLGDVTSAEDVGDAMRVASGLGPVRVLVNCAGIGSNERIATRRSSGATRAGDLDAFRRVIDINLVGTFNCMRLFAEVVPDPAEGQDCAGVIVNTASLAAFDGQTGQAAYSASKAAVVAMSFVAARDMAHLGIRTNAIAPGLMETPLFATVRDDIRRGLVESVVHPSRVGRPNEFASLACFLIDNDYINGETIRLDAAARLPYHPTVLRAP